ncbi:hypothetical protein ANCDUO_19463, partial [Ancylostoma duodenale]
VKYFNDDLEKVIIFYDTINATLHTALQLDGAADDVEYKLLNKMETYGRLCGVIRELDRIFRLYAFIMLVIIIPTVIFTLMMLTQQMRGLRDLIICLPSTALCAYSFLGVTVAPARLHDEVGRSKTFSVMAMVLSMIIQLTPALHALDVMNCSTSNP